PDVCALAADGTKARPTSARSSRRFIALPEVQNGNTASVFTRSDQHIPTHRSCVAAHYLTTERILLWLARPARACPNTASAQHQGEGWTHLPVRRFSCCRAAPLPPFGPASAPAASPRGRGPFFSNPPKACARVVHA